MGALDSLTLQWPLQRERWVFVHTQLIKLRYEWRWCCLVLSRFMEQWLVDQCRNHIVTLIGFVIVNTTVYLDGSWTHRIHITCSQRRSEWMYRLCTRKNTKASIIMLLGRSCLLPACLIVAYTKLTRLPSFAIFRLTVSLSSPEEIRQSMNITFPCTVSVPSTRRVHE
jgi:hypothetical protein